MLKYYDKKAAYMEFVCLHRLYIFHIDNGRGWKLGRPWISLCNIIFDVLQTTDEELLWVQSYLISYNVSTQLSFDLNCHLTLLKEYMGTINKLIVNDDAKLKFLEDMKRLVSISIR